MKLICPQSEFIFITNKKTKEIFEHYENEDKSGKSSTRKGLKCSN